MGEWHRLVQTIVEVVDECIKKGNTVLPFSKAGVFRWRKAVEYGFPLIILVKFRNKCR